MQRAENVSVVLTQEETWERGGKGMWSAQE